MTGIKIKGNAAEIEQDKSVLGQHLMKNELGVNSDKTAHDPELENTPVGDGAEGENVGIDEIFPDVDVDESVIAETLGQAEANAEAEEVAASTETDVPVLTPEELAELNAEGIEGMSLEEDASDISLPEGLEPEPTVRVEPPVHVQVPAEEPVVDAPKPVAVAPKKVVTPVSPQPPAVLPPVVAPEVDTKFLTVAELVALIDDKAERKEFNPAIISIEARANKAKGGLTAAELLVYLEVSRQAHILDAGKWTNSASWLRELARLRKKKNNKVKDADPLTETALLAEMDARLRADVKV